MGYFCVQESEGEQQQHIPVAFFSQCIRMRQWLLHAAGKNKTIKSGIYCPYKEQLSDIHRVYRQQYCEENKVRSPITEVTKQPCSSITAGSLRLIARWVIIIFQEQFVRSYRVTPSMMS